MSEPLDLLYYHDWLEAVGASEGDGATFELTGYQLAELVDEIERLRELITGSDGAARLAQYKPDDLP